jgi:hypothetical protein
MGIVVQITDSRSPDSAPIYYNNAYCVSEPFLSKRGERMETKLRFYANIAAYKDKKPQILQDLNCYVDEGHSLFDLFFANPVLNQLNKSLAIQDYEILKTFDGVGSVNGVGGNLIIVEVVNGKKLVADYSATVGIDFTSAVSSFSQAEIDAAAIDGLVNPAEGYRILNKGTEVFMIFTSGAFVNE